MLLKQHCSITLATCTLGQVWSVWLPLITPTTLLMGPGFSDLPTVLKALLSWTDLLGYTASFGSRKFMTNEWRTSVHNFWEALHNEVTIFMKEHSNWGGLFFVVPILTRPWAPLCLLRTVPNESYHFWAVLLHKWLLQGVADIHEYSFKMLCLPIILINFSWAKSHNLFIMEKSKFTLLFNIC